MILINLLPAEFRKGTLGESRFLRLLQWAKLGGILFLILTLALYAHHIFVSRALAKLQTQWQQLESDVMRIQQMRDEMNQGSKAQKDFLEKYVVAPFRATSILTYISEFLPDSIWLVELKILRQPLQGTLFLKGLSLPSGERSSVQQIEKYLGDLKAKFPEDTVLVLTTSRQQKEKAELTFFMAAFKWT